MVRPDGSAILIDLGGARHLDETSITAPGATFGTVGYFSPEQYRAERALTSASDVFTLAVVLLQCLLGRHPTNCDQGRLATAPPPVATLVPAVSKQLQDVLDRMLQLRAAFRPSLSELESTFANL